MNLGALRSSVHAGTHADAPLHVESAWGASETLPVAAFVGEACVIALQLPLPPDTPITVEMLRESLVQAGVGANAEALPPWPRRLLCRTGCTVADGRFPDRWPALDDEAATWLLASGVQLWGTDAPSVDVRTSTDLPVHHRLFRGGAYVLENLALRNVAPGWYELLAQPLAVHGADGAPVRALLRERAP